MRQRSHSVTVALAVLVAAAAALPAGAQALPRPAAETPPAQDFQAPPGARVTDEGWLAPRVAPHRPTLPDEVAVAAVIPIRGTIDRATYDIVAQKVAEARQRGARIIIFEMDTPGGLLSPTREIVRMLIDELADIYTVAYVNPEAYSAGAIIAVACDEIVMTATGVMGAAMPMSISPEGGVQDIPGALREKGESPLRAEARISAKHNGYSEALCQAMITVSVEVWLIRNRETGELRYVDARDWSHKVIGGPASADDTAGETTDPADRQWEYLRTVDDAGQLLTVTADEAIAMGFTERLFESMDELKEHYHIAELVRLEHTAVQAVAELMNSMVVSTLLITATLVLAYMEIRTPGFGVAGVLALVCLGVLLGSRYILDLANYWELLVIAAGLIMLLVEVFVTPGFGVLGITGIVLMVAGLLATGFRGDNPDAFSIPRSSLDWQLLADTAVSLSLGFIGSLIAGVLVSKYLPKARFATPLILEEVPPVNEAPVPETSPMRSIRLGDTGVVESVCRPVGKVRFGQVLVDAMSDGAIIDVGARVKVLRRDGNRLVVEELS